MRASIRPSILLLATVVAAALLGVRAPVARAHCDTMDGPVVHAGQQALATGDLDYALIWIKTDAEPELRAAFQRALAVRKLGRDARALADQFFLETLVRLHRAGEGAPYTGIEPAGTDLGPAIPAADKALASGATGELEALLTDGLHRALAQRFADARAARTYGVHDVAAGRRYVAAYVEYVHFVERVYLAATAGTGDEHDHGTR